MVVEIYENKNNKEGKEVWLFRYLFVYLGAILPLISMYHQETALSAFTLEVSFSLPVTLFVAAVSVSGFLYLFFSHGKYKKRIAILGIITCLCYLVIAWQDIAAQIGWWLYRVGVGDFLSYYLSGGDSTTQTHLISVFVILYVLLIVSLSGKRLIRFPLFLLAFFWAFFGSVEFELLFHWRLLFFILYFFCLFGMGKKRTSRTHGKQYRSQIDKTKKIAIWQNGMVLALIGIVLGAGYMLIKSPEQYEDNPVFTKKHDQFVDFIENHTWEEAWKILKRQIVPTDMAAGGMAGGKLGRAKGIEYQNIPQLEIILPLAAKSQGIYIKGFVGGKYTGSEWIEEDEQEEFEREEQTYYILSGMEEINTRAITISVLDADSSYSYRPYYSKLSSGLQRERQDGSVSYSDRVSGEEKDAVYSFCKYDNAGIFAINNYRYGTSSDEFADAVVQEKKYQKEVKEKYLAVPVEQKKLDMEMSQQNIEDANGEMFIRDGKMIKGYYESHGINAYVKFVQNFLSEHATYSLKPGKLPEGDDFVEDFLYEKKKGYCTAFASAGVMVFRRLGIPARYVEGYIVGKNDFSDGMAETAYMNENYVEKGEATYGVVLTLTDRNAHAWVEIYEEGVGWIPVEVTPGYEGEVSVMGEMTTWDQGETTQNIQTESRTTRSGKNDVTKKTQNNSGEESPTQTTNSTQESAGAKGETRWKLMGILLWVVAAYIIISVWMTYRKKHKIYYKKKKKQKKKKNHPKQDYVVAYKPRTDYERQCMKWEKAWNRVLRFQGYRQVYPQQLWSKANLVVQIYTYLDINEVYEHLKLLEKCHYSKEGISKQECKALYDFLYGMVFASYTHARAWEKPLLKILVSRYFHFS